MITFWLIQTIKRTIYNNKYAENYLYTPNLWDSTEMFMSFEDRDVKYSANVPID